MSDLMGLCSMCGRSGMMFTCHLCGRLVCERCYDHRHFLCSECQYQKKRTNSPFYPID